MINQLRKISLIHAIKCSKITDMEIAIESFSKLEDLKNKINSEQEVSEEVAKWMNEAPNVNEQDINNLNGNK